jgi:hypothetical protein
MELDARGRCIRPGRPARFLHQTCCAHAINPCDQYPVNKTTQQWQKRLESSNKPAYLLLADLIADDIRTGRLVARDQLPTLRDLAADLCAQLHDGRARLRRGAQARADRFALGHRHLHSRRQPEPPAARWQRRRDDDESAARARRTRRSWSA